MGVAKLLGAHCLNLNGPNGAWWGPKTNDIPFGMLFLMVSALSSLGCNYKILQES